MAVNPTSIDVQMQFSGVGGAWTSVYADVLGDPSPSLTYGINGNGPQDRVAETGTFTFALKNSAANSGGLIGYYSPGHANCRSGFEIGIRVRVVIAYGGTSYYKFVGTLTALSVVPGAYGERKTLCTVVDWMDDAAKQKINNVATQVGKRADELLTTLIANVTRQPVSTSFAEAQTAWPYALDTAQDESTTAMAELVKIADSDLGYIYVIGDTSAGGKLRFDDRRVRQAAAANSATLSSTMSDMDTNRDRERVANRVKAVVHPRVVDVDATTVLYTLDQTAPPSIAPGASLVIFAPYTDPTTRAVRVGGTDMVTPVSGTDYAFGTGPGDTSLTASLGVSVSYGGNGAIYTLTNNGAVTGFVTLLQARGRGLYDYNAVTVSETDSTSKTAYGEKVLTLDMPYETNETTANSIADVYLSKLKDPRYYVDGVSFVANNSDALMTAALAREPGDGCILTETVSGLSGTEFFINDVTLTLLGNNIIQCSWVLAPRLFTDDVFTLNTDTLNSAAVLGF